MVMKAYDTNHLTYLTAIRVLDQEDLEQKQFLVKFGFFYKNPKSGIDQNTEQWLTFNLSTKEVDKKECPDWKYKVPAYFQKNLFSALRENWKRASSNWTFDKPITKHNLRQFFDLLFDADPHEQRWKEEHWSRSPMLLWYRCPECQEEACYPINAAKEKSYFGCGCGQGFLCEFVTPLHFSDDHGPYWITRSGFLEKEA